MSHTMKAADAVKRYDLDREIDGARMVEMGLGDYVSYDDYVAALSAAEERERVLREALEDALPRIENWSNAYPESMFREPDWAKVRELLGDTLLTQVSGANMRHVATRMWAILQPVAALATPAPQQPSEQNGGSK